MAATINQGRIVVLLELGIVATAVAACRFSAHAAGVEATPLGWAVAFAALVVFNLWLGGAYRRRFVLHFLDDARTIVGSTAIAAMVVSFSRLLVGGDPEIAAQASRLWLFTAAYLVAGRAVYSVARGRARRLGTGGTPALIVGAGLVGQMVAARLLERPEYGLKPVAFLDDDPLSIEDPVDLPIVSSVRSGADNGSSRLTAAMEEIIDERGIGHVVIAFSRATRPEELALVRRARARGVPVSLVPRLFESVSDQTALERIGGIPLVAVESRDPRAWQFRVKYAVDRVLAALAVALVSPLLLAAATGTLVSVGRPILFRQERVGLDGRAFAMLKFRTMRGSPDELGEADADWAARMTTGRDSLLSADQETDSAGSSDRTTSFGSLLRLTSLDELPQLLNVLKGDMAIVGPRPERRAYVELFERSVNRYDDRHRVKAGITGWAQVSGLRGETSLADRVEWDNYYIENWSPWLDMKILLLTSIAIIRPLRRRRQS